MRWAVTTNSCGGLGCLHPVIPPSSASSPLQRAPGLRWARSVSHDAPTPTTFSYLMFLDQRAQLYRSLSLSLVFFDQHVGVLSPKMQRTSSNMQRYHNLAASQEREVLKYSRQLQ